MTDNVMSINGGYQGAQNADLIERLELLLADAKAGITSGIIYSCTEMHDNSAIFGHAGVQSFTSVGALDAAKHGVIMHLRGEGE